MNIKEARWWLEQAVKYLEHPDVEEIPFCVPSRLYAERIRARLETTDEPEAPELAEALKSLEEIASLINAKQHSGSKIRPDQWSDLFEECNNARAALKKAGCL